MSRTTAVSIATIILSIVGGLTYEAHRRFQSLASTIDALAHKVDQATQVADSAAVDAREARAQAAQSAENAKAAASGRVQAEHLQQQAAAGQAEAETAAQQAREQAVAAHQQMTQMRREREEELNHMQEVLSHIVQTRRTNNGMVMSLPDNTFTFDFDSAELKPANRELLSRIAGILLVAKGYGLSVFGYTDDVGTADYNQKLSLRRASAVRDYLVQAGIESGIVNVKGYGKTSPIAQGSTDVAERRTDASRSHSPTPLSDMTFPVPLARPQALANLYCSEQIVSDPMIALAAQKLECSSPAQASRQFAVT